MRPLSNIWVYSSLPYLRYCFFSFQAVLSTAWGKLLFSTAEVSYSTRVLAEHEMLTAADPTELLCI